MKKADIPYFVAGVLTGATLFVLAIKAIMSKMS